MNEFLSYIHHWDLLPDGEPIITHTSRLLPVLYNHQPAMLKIVTIEEEQRGGELMVWWHGQGAARILAHHQQAFLMERSMTLPCLIQLVKQGNDTEASRILCGVVKQLHSASSPEHPPRLVSLCDWFKALEPAAANYGGIFSKALVATRGLLNNPRDQVVLHGDIHHRNVLYFGNRGWLAIDPKGLIGERGFDYANLFCNPDHQTATTPNRLQNQLRVVAEASQLEPTRLLKWILAYAGLSAAWHLEDGSNPELALQVAEIASSVLDSNP
ncbi:3'-kinase [Legionella sp. MW5194]|uniref:aminoglycoside phosphotransferase family protein n=1 Tax=Legionella sp. MW5194 TaxID=2662448 RepID=UPI00193E7558|nr:aminoglycoside phosphotransferase family protein [Legionella sp. MW5194]QRN04811.1 3'-kinase [Legionella sp. MW5194]